jgi:hypothetical protein
MTNQNSKLNKRQRMLLDELFAGTISEQEVLDKYRIGRSVFAKWLNEPVFLRALHGRIAAAYHQSSILLARHATAAANRLISLTESNKPDTARRSCLDIIEMGGDRGTKDEGREAIDEGRKMRDEGRGKMDYIKPGALSDSQASKILAALADKSEKS